MPNEVGRHRVREIHAELGIPADYEVRTGMPFIPEAEQLVVVSPQGREPERRLVPAAAAHWARLEAAAEQDGVRLVLISAFRSFTYQQELIRRKLERGEALVDILRVLAAPGYSEHHSGRAVDIGTPGCDPLSESFENTHAFTWLDKHGPQFGFRMSYPRDNPYGLIYEPWHWALDAERVV